jgi:hypothetical protein
MIHFLPLKNLIKLKNRALYGLLIIWLARLGTCGQRPWRQSQVGLITSRQILHFGGLVIFATA